MVATACTTTSTLEPAASAASGPDPVVVTAYEQALSQLERGEEAAAEVRLRGLAETHPEYAGPLVNLALIHARRDDLDGAAALLTRALEVCAQCAAAWTELGVLQRRQGQFALAEQSYLSALAAEPAHATAHFNLGVLYELYLQRPELALEHYARFRELRADDPMTGEVDKWMADLKRRVGAIERSAQVEAGS